MPSALFRPQTKQKFFCNRTYRVSWPWPWGFFGIGEILSWADSTPRGELAPEVFPIHSDDQRAALNKRRDTIGDIQPIVSRTVRAETSIPTYKTLSPRARTASS